MYGSMATRSVVFIHGMFMTPLCWEKWTPYFQKRGYTCDAPAWLGRTDPVEVLRQRHPDEIAGGRDNIVPAVLNRTNHSRYAASPSITDFKDFPGRAHFIIGQPGWEEVADYVLAWIKENGV